ncbi:hypothetical protein JCM33374_g3393 [Metschnikowia sp. JCM 33374]|nr:hypothetical protein JCM33374_g3393 [Metschnikowia sp. JCM 33374]
MFASTPKKSRPSVSIDRIGYPASNTNNVSLPPLSAMLGDEMSSPLRPSLPAISSFATPQTPRYMLPSIRSTSTPSLATLPEFSNSQPASASTTNQTIDSVSKRDEPVSVSASTRATSSVSAPVSAIKRTPNSSMDFDADASILNDSMIKPALKRKMNTASPTRDFAFISHSPATYPSQEPAIDNASLARRKRRRTSPNELAVLNQQFKLGSTPDKNRRLDIAAKVNMTEKAVQIWFQNKRQSLRRLKNSDREVTELPPTPDSSVNVSVQPSGDSVPPPLFESTPLRPVVVKSEAQEFPRSPTFMQSSPLRCRSASDVGYRSPHSIGSGQVQTLNKDAGVKVSLFSKMLGGGSDRKDGPEPQQLVMNLTNKKQPEFARHSAQASNQVMTFKLTPKERKPLGALNTNTLNQSKTNSTKDSQCIQGLLSLKVGHH